MLKNCAYHFCRSPKMCALASIKFRGQPNIREIYEIHEIWFLQKLIALKY